MTDAVAITGFASVAAPAGGRAELPVEALPGAVRARAARAERITQLVLASGGVALAAAGLAELDGPPRPRLGVIVGTAFGCILTNAAYAERLVAAGPAAASPRAFAATVSNAAAGELAIAYRLGGPCITLTAGGAAGLVALAHAIDLLRTEQADALVAGGADAWGPELDGALADSGLCVPADTAAAFVLERAGEARRAPQAFVLGAASGFGRDTLPAVVQDALAEAGIRGADVDILIGHGLDAVPDLGRTRVEAVVAPTCAGGGPLHLVRALAGARRAAAIVVVDACPSGHVAALVARTAGDA